MTRTTEDWARYITGQLHLPDAEEREWLRRQLHHVAGDAVMESGVPRRESVKKKNQSGVSFYFWKFVHNALIHPLMAFPIAEPKWLCFLHDWTAERCQGAG